MPLERFIPKSPDPFIRNSQDFEVAKFGHLNTIIEYVNNYVVTDGLQLSGTGPLSTSLRNVTDNLGNVSPLKLSTLGVQIVSPLRISTDDPSDMYLDCEDGSENNRFNITRNTGSQQVNLNFASNPTGSTSIVGAIRTYANGSTLSEVLQFREDGTIFGSGSQTASNFVIQKDVTNDLIIYSSASWGGLLTPPTSGGANTMLNGRITGTHGGYGNVAVGLGTVQADGSAYNFNTAMGQGSFARGINCTAIGQGANAGSSTAVPSNATALGYGAIALTSNAFALGDASALLQIGGNFTPTAKVHIKGLGSTSATTSLLVQNSGGTETFRVYDSGSVSVRLGLTVGSGQSVSDGTFALFNNRLETYNAFSIQTIPENRLVNLSPATINVLSANYYLGGNQIGVVVYDSGSYSHFSSAVLQVNSTTRGFLPPRMTTTQRTAIASPAAGLIVYDTTTNKSYTYDGTTWQAHY